MQRCGSTKGDFAAEGLYSVTLMALSNIACDKTPGVTMQLIESKIFQEAIHPLYIDTLTDLRIKHELAYCICNSLKNCDFD